MPPLSSFDRLGFVLMGLVFAVGPLFSPTTAWADAADAGASVARTPVIVDTDIGDDTDDYWALAYALKSPKLDVKLVTTTYGKQQYRGALIAKFLLAAGRTDIPIGIGMGPDGTGGMQAWLGNFSLASYQGKVATDGVQAMIDTINSSPTPVTVIAIGPVNTIGAALQKDPGIAAKANLCAMAGSIRVGYGNKPGQIGEYNVCRDVQDAQRVFSAPWISIAITPLDTGDSVTLVGERYLALLPSHDPLLQTLLSVSAAAHRAPDPAKINFSGSGFDTVAVLLAEQDPSHFTNLEDLKIVVDPHGKTNIDPAGTAMKVATTWKDLNGYLDYLKQTMLLPPTPAAP
jgi:inosine-uridine nucleoside N-ribohydrolase